MTDSEMCSLKSKACSMTPRRHPGAVVRLSAVAFFGLLALSLQRGGYWLVTHDSVYYWLTDRGLRFVTNCAEVLFFFGPALSFCAGLFFGLLIIAGLRFYRAYYDSGV